MHCVSYSIILIHLLGPSIATPVDTSLDVHRPQHSSWKPPALPDLRKYSLESRSPLPVKSLASLRFYGVRVPKPAIGQSPQKNSQNSSTQNPANVARANILRKPKTKAKSLTQCTAGNVPSILDLVARNSGIPRQLLEPKCPVTPRKPQGLRKASKRGQEGPSRPSGKRPHSPGPQGATPPKRGKRLFLGYRGTTNNTAQAYRQNGLENSPFNGNFAALGAGVYLTDDLKTARHYAVGSARAANENKIPAIPSLCTIFADDESFFRESIRKAFLPPSTWAPDVTNHPYGSRKNHVLQLQWIRDNAVELDDAPEGSIVKFSSMSPTCPLMPSIPNQIMIPPALLQHFSIGECRDFNECDAVSDFGLPSLNSPSPELHFRYNGNPALQLDHRRKLEEWDIYGAIDDDDD